jgi:serine/threonine-protein kinase SRPK3
MRHLLRTVFGKLTRVKPPELSLATVNATHLPLDVPIGEERKQDYDPRHFYPVKLGEIFHDKYEVVVKVGFGGSSSAWNLQRYVFSLTVT